MAWCKLNQQKEFSSQRNLNLQSTPENSDRGEKRKSFNWINCTKNTFYIVSRVEMVSGESEKGKTEVNQSQYLS